MSQDSQAALPFVPAALEAERPIPDKKRSSVLVPYQSPIPGSEGGYALPAIGDSPRPSTLPLANPSHRNGKRPSPGSSATRGNAYRDRLPILRTSSENPPPTLARPRNPVLHSPGDV